MISIGKMAQYCHTSVQTLRLYANASLLVPAYVDPQSHYRYYQPEQIFQFNLIKYLQTTNLSLKEIKRVLSDDSINLQNFWSQQEENINEQIKEEYRKLALAQFQQRQLANLSVMKAHLNQGPYIKTIHKTIAMIPVSSPFGPNDVPDQSVAQLDQCLLDSGQIPNLEYGFTFKFAKNKEIKDIHYQAIFKELIFDDETKNSFQKVDVSGDYLCTNFMWSTHNYLSYLQQLFSAAGHPSQAVVYEESFPLSYVHNGFAKGKEALTELRIKLPS